MNEIMFVCGITVLSFIYGLIKTIKKDDDVPRIVASVIASLVFASVVFLIVGGLVW